MVVNLELEVVVCLGTTVGKAGCFYLQTTELKMLIIIETFDSAVLGGGTPFASTTLAVTSRVLPDMVIL